MKNPLTLYDDNVSEQFKITFLGEDVNFPGMEEDAEEGFFSL